MTPEEQRIAIAEVCGWTHVHHSTKLSTNLFNKMVGVSPSGISDNIFVPNYPTNLNAMHEAEKALSPNDTVVYAGHLTRGKEIWDVIPNDESFPVCPAAICATAAQRAEAFLRTLGKWKD